MGERLNGARSRPGGRRTLNFEQNMRVVFSKSTLHVDRVVNISKSNHHKRSYGNNK